MATTTVKVTNKSSNCSLFNKELTMSTSFNNKESVSTIPPVLYSIDTVGISKEISSNDNNENSNWTSQITINKNIPLGSVNVKKDNNGASARKSLEVKLSCSQHDEYVKQRPNKLVRADLLKDQKRLGLNSPNGVNKMFKSQIVNKQCSYFNKYGRCKDGHMCPYSHNPNRVGICKKWLKGVECSGKKCFRQHNLSAHVIPHCSHFAKGMCLKGNECRYTHVKVSMRADYCREFMVDGFCDAGEKCRKKHEWGEYKEPVIPKNQSKTKKQDIDPKDETMNQENNNKRARREEVEEMTEMDPWKLSFISIVD